MCRDTIYCVRRISKKHGKFTMLLFVLVGHRLDLAVGTSYIKDAVCIAFMANELLSLVENAGLMGVPIPAVLKNAIDILKKKTDKEGEQ